MKHMCTQKKRQGRDKGRTWKVTAERKIHEDEFY